MNSFSVMDRTDDAETVKEIDAAVERLGAAKAEVDRIIFGQGDVVERSLIAVLCGGHALLVGVPGLAKTKLVSTLGTVLGLDDRRIQFTPDLMPSDILGAEVLEQAASGERAFRFIKGPVFAQLLMADEINRASPRTQSALLQAMQEGFVTVAGTPHALPTPFHVLATQNPLEQEGTYPLPEAQLDRFLMQIDVVYPHRDAERRILLDTTGVEDATPAAILTREELMSFQTLVRRIPVGEAVVDAILDLIRSARPEDNEDMADKIAWGPGPRAGQALMLAVRARAMLTGRLAPSRDDVTALAEPILQHRMALTYTARADGHTVKGIIAELAGRL
ncbi:AAA family ATPase [Acuticoccus mangrovi]|uniref:MoxR family ATPase n=1 Tax=Acuticoccus mangrovi TaxID=2796142 RepID=A0A934INQ9_9HYPH|nr:MoxR family ATPase [Acuticoccus mangrovi]MBJ3775955.1 MoxR family ATPase [Acuticoccus mangrovi]